VTTITGMLWELFVAGMLFYGLALVGIAAANSRGGTRRLEAPDNHDAPILVKHRSSQVTTATVATRSGHSDN
jgi:hypothetical protein